LLQRKAWVFRDQWQDRETIHFLLHKGCRVADLKVKNLIVLAADHKVVRHVDLVLRNVQERERLQHFHLPAKVHFLHPDRDQEVAVVAALARLVLLVRAVRKASRANQSV
jgi:hypothetical protein